MGRTRTGGAHGELNWRVGRRRGWDVLGPLRRVPPASQCQGCEHQRGVASTIWARRRQGCCSGKPAWGWQDAHTVSSGCAWPLQVRVGARSLPVHGWLSADARVWGAALLTRDGRASAGSELAAASQVCRTRSWGEAMAERVRARGRGCRGATVATMCMGLCGDVSGYERKQRGGLPGDGRAGAERWRTWNSRRRH
jgi:hypothetical protein